MSAEQDFDKVVVVRRRARDRNTIVVRRRALRWDEVPPVQRTEVRIDIDESTPPSGGPRTEA